MSIEHLNPEQFDPNAKGKQFASLTYQGQLYYADRIKEGDNHDRAFADAKFSYGVKR